MGTRLIDLIDALAQGHTLYCPAMYITLTSQGDGMVRRIQYLIEEEWAPEETFTLEQLREGATSHEEHLKEDQQKYGQQKDYLQQLDLIFPFGHHRGQKLSQIPKSYLMWAVTTIKDRPALITKVMEFLRTHERIEEWPFDANDFDFDWQREE